jgi:hypothetical protein
MSGDELRTRLSQAAHKRVDVAAHVLGYDGFGKAPIATTSTGKFFFSPDEVGERVSLLREFLPGEVQLIQNQAGSICQHRFDLLGYTGLDYGQQIDWHLDAHHGKRAPRKPWYRINFLDFHEVGDHKVTWELNRHQHLVTLGKAWALTRDAQYVEELVKQWYSWQQANPYPIGINWGSALEVAFRSLSWIWVLRLLDDSAPVPDNFRSDLTRGLALNGRYIEKYLSSYFSPNTHLLGEAVALFFIGTLFGQLPRSKRWRDRGWDIILQAAQRQVRPDGVYFEQALHYHVYALDFFLHTRILAALNGMAIPSAFDEVVERMLDVLEALSQAGPPESFGDDDGGRVFSPRRNQAEHMTDPLVIGAAVYGRESTSAAARLTEEAVWLVGRPAIESLKRQPRRPRSRAFAAGGVYVMAGASPAPHQMVVDAGPQGVGRCGHGHADALSLRMAIRGQRFLVDPGTGVYISDSNDRDLFRGTGAHNVVRVDEQDQAVPAGPFAWNAIPTTRVERWTSGEAFDFFCASHDGYARLREPVVHRRFVFRGPEGVLLVRDVCEGEGTHQIESFWHFGEGIHLRKAGDAVLASNDANSSRLELLAAGNCAWQVETGSGLVSPAYGEKKPAPMARISASAKMPAECAVLIDFEEARHAPGEFRYSRDPQTREVTVYEYTTPDRIHRFVFAPGRSEWTAGEWRSDAQFLYCVSAPQQTNAAQKVLRVIMVAGTFLSRQGARLVGGADVRDQWEWARNGLTATPSTLELAER